MYRQILIDPIQRDLQRIVWKTSVDAAVKVYKLSTVTYGTVSVTFLATRTLSALADEEEKDFPKLTDVICTDIYMYDILTGEVTIEDAKKLQAQVCQIFLRAGFELHKWVSNSPDILQDLSTSFYAFDKGLEFGSVKTLRMLWDAKIDCLTYDVNIKDKDLFLKKRSAFRN
ncbi:hypothetical protein AVEN_54582-1 [Araneus ventricosus]|uniref:Uncharacterized protein n=1 Tax=Araneus ventricosus TaxID=182803 RepID=A0A4Y2BMJ7_ARAVE|nr:hypothetical protein AVEN_54582-1 [Araneus ventricosus]